MTHRVGRAQGRGRPSTQVRGYTLFMTTFSLALLIRLMWHPALALDDPKDVARFGPAKVAVLTLALMALGGALGGCLYGLRSLSLHAAAEDYSAGHNFSHYVRPLSSAISGLMVCLLLLGGALTLSTGSADKAGWLTFSGRMPYLACSLLAGYSGHKFMLKLGGLADYIFAVTKQNRSSDGKTTKRVTSARRPSSAKSLVSSQRAPGHAA